MRRAIVGLTIALLATSGASVSAQIYVLQSLERDFRIEWQSTRDRQGPAIDGYLYNTSFRTAQRVRLQIARLDGAGTVIGNSTIWVPGEVRLGDRAYFTASVPEAAGYRVQVLSFDWSCEGGGGGM